MDIRAMSREDRLRRAGCPEQLYGVRAVTLADGRGSGCALWEAESGGGLTVDVLPDNCLDLGRLRYKGINISFLAKNGYIGPSGYTLEEFGRSFYAGMMYTCGLMSTGVPSQDKDGRHAPHGRIHYIASEGRFYRTDEEKGELVMGGRMREAQLFGYALQIDRTIRVPIGESRVEIEDVITNTTPNPTEYAVLYHCNFGYPFLSEHLKMILPEGTRTKPRTARAAEGMNEFCEFTPPQDSFEEQVYFHDLPREAPVVRLENSELGIGASVEFDKAATPIVAQWKSMASTDYALGIEPTNNFIMGRAAERENGTLACLGGFESIRTKIVIRLYDL